VLPTTLIGLVVLIFSLVPGFVFHERWETRRPARTGSVLRESAAVLVASLAANAAAVAVFAVISFWIPGSRTAVDSLFSEGTSWFETNYRSALVSAVLLILFASCLSFVVAAPPGWVPGMGTRLGQRWRGQRQVVESSWTIAFRVNNPEELHILVGVQLTSGQFLRGVLDHWTSDRNDGPDRTILLRTPLEMRVKGEFVRLAEHSAAVRASEIDYVTVAYITKAALAAHISLPAAPAPKSSNRTGRGAARHS